MTVLHSFLNYFILSAPYLLLGFMIAGGLRAFVSVTRITKGLGKDNLSSIIKASIIGVPLPLCSCSVVPTAVALKKSGASRSAVSSFLISTPESGVDSIALTYGIMDLPMTIFRPLAAFTSAFVAGTLQMLCNKEVVLKVENDDSKEAEGNCGCDCSSSVKKKPSFLEKIKKGIRFSFIELFEDMSGWLFVGLVCGALIDAFVPVGLLQGANGIQGRFIILAIGIPLYICASSSTPVAAALVMKGLSPGCALLFMLVGPATNISSIAILQKYLGKKGLLLNIIAIAVVALLFSYAVDWFYSYFNFPIAFNVPTENEGHHVGLFQKFIAGFFALLLANGLYHQFKKKFLNYGDDCCH